MHDITYRKVLKKCSLLLEWTCLINDRKTFDSKSPLSYARSNLGVQMCVYSQTTRTHSHNTFAYIHTHTYIHPHTIYSHVYCTHTCTLIHTHTHSSHTFTHTISHLLLHAYEHTCTHALMHIHANTYVLTDTSHTPTRLQTHKVHSHTFTPPESLSKSG